MQVVLINDAIPATECFQELKERVAVLEKEVKSLRGIVFRGLKKKS